MKLNIHKPVTMTLAQTLTEGRKAKGLTLREVETVTGLSNAQVSLIESGKTENPSAKSIFRLSALYGIRLSALATYFK